MSKPVCQQVYRIILASTLVICLLLLAKPITATAAGPSVPLNQRTDTRREPPDHPVNLPGYILPAAIPAANLAEPAAFITPSVAITQAFQRIFQDDIMPSPGRGANGGLSPASDTYIIQPILFVPQDLTAHPRYLDIIDMHMQFVQAWYGWQMRDKTFELAPALVIQGSYPLAHYYEDCPIQTPDCDWGFNIWDEVVDDLVGLGYGYSDKEVLGIFLQTDGHDGPALGGGNISMVDLANIMGDCLGTGCNLSVGKGAMAHELGHAFGLGHTVDDPEGSPSLSVMSYGFYNFPAVTFVNTTLNPELDTLASNPFLIKATGLHDGSFEDCLSHWTESPNAPVACSDTRRSGLTGLQHAASSGVDYEVYQDLPVVAGKVYDFSGWVNLVDYSAGALEVQILALSSGGEVLTHSTVTTLEETTQDWERIAQAVTMPAGTANARVVIKGVDPNFTAYTDDFSFYPTDPALPTPFPLNYSDGMQMPTLRPTLQWNDLVRATAYRLQVSTDPGFYQLTLDTTTTSPFYTFSTALTPDTRYYWRTKAFNGATETAWSETWNFVTRPNNLYRTDEFDSYTMSPYWSWVREDMDYYYLTLAGSNWRLSISTEPVGSLAGPLNNAHNLLLQEIPAGDFEASINYSFWPLLEHNYQQAGLLIYQDDDNYLMLARVFRDGHTVEFQVEREGQLQIYSLPLRSRVPLKIQREGQTYRAYYSPHGLTWLPVGLPVTVDWDTPRMGVAAYNGVEAPAAHTHFEWFRYSHLTTADLALTQVANSPVITAGQPITFSLIASNTGATPSDARLVQLLTPTLAISQVSVPADCSANGPIICELPNLTGTQIFTVVVTSTTGYSGSIASEANLYVVGDELDNQPGNNQAGLLNILVQSPAPPDPDPTQKSVYLPLLLK